jgi:hypothetical protein
LQKTVKPQNFNDFEASWRNWVKSL